MWLNAAHMYCNIQGIDTCALSVFYISSAKMEDIILSMEVLRNKKKIKKMWDLMMTMHPLVPGCVHAHIWSSLGCASDSIWDRHLRGEQLCKIMSFSKSDSDFNNSTEKNAFGYETNTLFFQMTQRLLKFITLYVFLSTCFCNSDLTVLKHWHSCEIS